MQRFIEETDFKAQEFNFFINGREYEAKANYTITTRGEHPSWDYEGDSETEIEALDVYDAMTYSDDLDEWISVSVSNEIEEQVIVEIEKHHKL